jgi:FkbM family methyltransferase
MVETAPLWVTLSASAIRRLPFGRYRLSDTLGRFSRRPFLARLPVDLGAAEFVCDLGDTISREVCFTGRYEPQETELIRRLLRPGQTTVDVGANWGYFSLVCAHLVGEQGRVVSLEPHPRLYTLLADNVARNRLRQVECLRVGAGATRGLTSFIAFDEHGGNWGVSRVADRSERPDFECEVIALDELIDARGIDQVDLVKIDVEGAEPDVLRGMAAGLDRRRYRFVLIECHPGALAWTDGRMSLDQCLAPLRHAAYEGWHIDHSLSMHRRAASGSIRPADMLAPIDPGALALDAWPHFLWTVPGERIPA